MDQMFGDLVLSWVFSTLCHFVGGLCRGRSAAAQMELSARYAEGLSRPIAVHRCAVNSSQGIWRCCLRGGLQSLKPGARVKFGLHLHFPST